MNTKVRVPRYLSRRRRRLLRIILRSDQKDRESRPWSEIEQADTSRLAIASACFALQRHLPLTLREARAVVIIAHHAMEYRLARSCAELAWRKWPGPESAWLVAIVVDRAWYIQNGTQLYGTQYWRERDGGLKRRPLAEATTQRRFEIQEYLKNS